MEVDGSAGVKTKMFGLTSKLEFTDLLQIHLQHVSVQLTAARGDVDSV